MRQETKLPESPRVRRQVLRRLLTVVVGLLLTTSLLAQLRGVVVDAQDGGPVPYATVQYRGNRVATKCDGQGRFTIARHNGWRLTVSSVGYREQVLNVNPQTPAQLTIRLADDSRTLSEVTVKSKKKTRYRRKDNPAVEFMRKVIASRKKTSLKSHDYYRFEKYQKLMLGLNDLSPGMLDKGLFKRYPWLRDQVDTCQYNDKLVLPLTVDEQVSEHLWRRDPQKERIVIKGQKASGVNDLFQTGDMLTQVMREVFADIDIYDDYILLMRHKFSSPIGRDAIQFYRFYITDTVYVGQDRCVHLDFVPNNQQDFGFRGQLYVLADSSYQVKRCELFVPRSGDLNWVEGLQCMQEFTRQADGEWLLTIDDMIVELMLTDFITKAIVTRTTRMSDFAFTPLPAERLRGSGLTLVERGATQRDDKFWEQHRQVEFTRSERGMGGFLSHIEQLKGYKYAIFLLKALVENYLETGTREKPSKFDVGPINTVISQNFYDGLRLRASGQTTANLHPRLFAKGYYAYGTRTHNHYYNAELTYSFEDKQYLPQEFPVRHITLASRRDVALPSDKYSNTDKDNVFTSFKVHSIDKMLLYNTQRLSLDYETHGHLRLTTALQTEKIEPRGTLLFAPLSGPWLSSLRTTDASLTLRYAPDEKFVNTKQRRRPMNKDAWYVSAKHTLGLNGVGGGEATYNFSELEFYRRTWLPMSWGHIDARARLAQQWNQVPWPLLVMPQANLSYIIDYGQFSTMNNMEFLNDRYASLMLTWEMGGKLFNRIPLLRRLKWREVAEFKMLWGTLSEKNNPFLPQNQQNGRLWHFPAGSSIMDGSKPYMEYAVGIQNIFNLIQIEYVHRLNYNHLPTAQKHGIRFVINPTF